MISLIVIILLFISFFAFDSFNNKKLKEVVEDIEKTKAVLNLETQGEELKRIKLEEQTKQILKNHNITQKRIKKSLERMIDSERVEEIFKK